jgi:hypothetical protein
MQNGDVITRQKRGNPLFNHYGIVVDDTLTPPLIAHHSSCGGASIVTLDRFLGKHQLKSVENTPLSGKSTAEMLQHFSNRGNDEFDIILNNCESWAHTTSMNGNRLREIGKAALYVVLFVTALYLVAKVLRIV